MNPFEDLLKELGTLLETPLKPDEHQSCRIEFLDGITIQIDLSSGADQVLIGTDLGELPPGSYRKNILQLALQMNGQTEKQKGILAFSRKKNSLFLFQFFPLATLNGEKLFKFLEVFTEHARFWTTAIRRGETPQLSTQQVTQGSGFYGLRP